MRRAGGFEWRPVVGYEGSYEVSSDGRVRSTDRRVWNGYAYYLRPGAEMTKRITRLGYIYIKLSKGNRARLTFAHRIVAEAFLPREAGKDEVNHKDGNKQNNSVANLEWSDRRHNVRHSFDTGLRVAKRGEAVGTSKLTADLVLWILGYLKSGYSQQTIADVFGVTQRVVSLISRGLLWAHVRSSDTAKSLGVV